MKKKTINKKVNKSIKKSKNHIKDKDENSISLVSSSDNNYDIEIKTSESEDEENDEKLISMAKKAIDKARTQIQQSKNTIEQSESDSQEENNNLNNFFRKKETQWSKRDYLPLFNKIKSSLKSNKTLNETILRGHRGPITAALLHPLTLDLISVGKDGAILIFIAAKAYKRHVLNKGFPKSEQGHAGAIFSADISHNGKLLITGGKDRILRVWNLQNALETISNTTTQFNILPQTMLRGHHGPITCVHFFPGSLECVSGSEDQSFITWDAEQGGKIETFYGHKAALTALSPVSERHMLSVSIDKTPILWKTEKETQVLFQECLFSLDTVSVLNSNLFLTGSMGGELSIWNRGRKKPLKTLPDFESTGWVSASCAPFNSDYFVVGGISGEVRLYGYRAPKIGHIDVFDSISILTTGIVNHLSVSLDGKHLVIVEGSENRLGRWITTPNFKPSIRIINLF